MSAEVDDSVEDIRATGLMNGKPGHSSHRLSPAGREYHRYGG